jgi:stage V sporulation protein AC
MNMSKETYKKYADARAPRSPILKNCLRAFLVGGLICAFAQGLTGLYTKLCGMGKEDAGTLTACTLVLSMVTLRLQITKIFVFVVIILSVRIIIG